MKITPEIEIMSHEFACLAQASCTLVEVNRPDDSRERYLSEAELHRLKVALDEKNVPERHKGPQSDESSDEAHRADRRINRDALNRDSPALVVRRDV
jgi:hypothetical protein